MPLLRFRPPRSAFGPAVVSVLAACVLLVAGCSLGPPTSYQVREQNSELSVSGVVLIFFSP
jgi:hypothetical protein